MGKVNISYSEKKKEVLNYYSNYSDVNIDNIIEVNDLIVENNIKKDDLQNELLEFYITISMCTYMMENDLYDEYFFKTYVELLEKYNNGDFDNFFKNIINDKAIIEVDIEKISDYLKKDEIKSKYYDDVSTLYNDEIDELMKEE